MHKTHTSTVFPLFHCKNGVEQASILLQFPNHWKALSIPPPSYQMPASGFYTKDTLLLCLEMCCRGFYFHNIDIEKSSASEFVITDDQKGLIIPFKALDGLGENVAEQIVKARKQAPFISQEDLMTRGKVNNTSLEKLRELGCLDNLPESNQLSLF